MKRSTVWIVPVLLLTGILLALPRSGPWEGDTPAASLPAILPAASSSDRGSVGASHSPEGTPLPPTGARPSAAPRAGSSGNAGRPGTPELPDLSTMWSRGRAAGRGPVRLTHAPLRVEEIGSLVPMGLMVAAHVTPTSHQYYFPKDLQADRYRYEVRAPADGFIVTLQHRVHLDGTTETPREYDDYQVTIEHSGTFYTCYDLLTRLEPFVMEAVGGKLPGGPPSGVRVPVKAGQVFGRVGGRSLDFAVVNTEVTLPGLLVPAHYTREPRKIHTVDPFDYFDEPLKSQLLALNRRKSAPRGGKIDFDVEGRLVGNWFREGTNGYGGAGDPRGYWIGHLAMVDHHIDPSRLVLSIGDYEGRPRQFFVEGNGPDPASVSAATGPVKYALVLPTLGSDGQSYPGIDTRIQGVALAQVLTDRKLRFEVFAGKTPAEVKGFTEGARLYER